MVFTDGGSLGAWLSVIFFWVALAGALALWGRECAGEWKSSGTRGPLIHWSVGVVCVIAFLLGGISEDGSALDAVSDAVLLLGLLLFIGIAIARSQEPAKT